MAQDKEKDKDKLDKADKKKRHTSGSRSVYLPMI